MLKIREYGYEDAYLYLSSCDNYSHVRKNELTIVPLTGEVRDYTEGLCSICIKSNTCVFAGAEGGIWRCIDYTENE